MKRVHILLHHAKYSSVEYTTIEGVYSSAKKVTEAFNSIVEDFETQPNFEYIYKGQNTYYCKINGNTHFIYIKVKELQ